MRPFAAAPGPAPIVRELDGDFCGLAAQSGCHPRTFVELHTAPSSLGAAESVGGRVLMTGEAVHDPVLDVEADPEYDFGEGPRIGDYRSPVSESPLMRDGNLDRRVYAMRHRCSARSRPARSKSFRPSPTRPSSQSRTRACSTRCRRAPRPHRGAASSRPRPPMCSRSSAARPSICRRC